MRDRNGDDAAPAILRIVAVIIAILAFASGSERGYQSGTYTILKQAHEQGVLTITVDPITRENTYTWHPPTERK
jgi:hypothetical protein